MTQIENWKAKFIHDCYLELLEKTRQELHKAQDRLRDLGNVIVSKLPRLNQLTR
jgi:hypothetical protein